MTRKSFAVASALLCIAAISWAQNFPTQFGKSGASETELERIFGTIADLEPSKPMFFEGSISADEYIVGPGDKFKIFYWKPTFYEYSATVNAEGDLAIPLVGSVHVGGRTLADAKSAIKSAVEEKLRVGELSVSLTEPRYFRVHVTGEVMDPGTYVVPATARVADALRVAGGLKRDLNIVHDDSVWTITSSQRRIELRDADGTTTGRADLQLFLAGGILKANPLLKDGAIIFVPNPAYTSEQIGVFGGVYHDGLFEYVAGDRLKDALVLAGGLTTLADSSSIRVVPGDGSTSVPLSLLGAGGTSALEYSLKPGDRVYVGAFPDTSSKGSVTVEGQVAFPGGYPIIPGVTTVAEIIQNAGGLLPTAVPNSARLIRNQKTDFFAADKQRVLAAKVTAKTETAFPVDPELAAQFMRFDYSTVVLDLSEDAPKGSRANDVVLHDGDRLEIPSEPLGVRILGFVNNGGEVPWREDYGFNDYLKAAGGLNANGWKNRTVILKARNGAMIRYSHKVPIDPGDILFVPAKPTTTRFETVRDIVTVSAQLLTLVLVVDNFTNNR